MTKEELKKRLTFIKASDKKDVNSPKNFLRRDPNVIINNEEDDLYDESFFDFEEDLAEIESARKQYEKLQLNGYIADNYEADQDVDDDGSFLVFEEDEQLSDEVYATSFIIIEEEDDDENDDDENDIEYDISTQNILDLSQVNDHNIDISNRDKEDGYCESDSVFKDNSRDDNDYANHTTQEPSSEKKYTDVNGFEFKYCKYIKKNNEKCKRQAPKTSDYCGTHRKIVNSSK